MSCSLYVMWWINVLHISCSTTWRMGAVSLARTANIITPEKVVLYNQLCWIPVDTLCVWWVFVQSKFLCSLGPSLFVSNKSFLSSCRVRKNVPIISKLAIANLDLHANFITQKGQNVVLFRRLLACTHQCNHCLYLRLFHIHLLQIGSWGGLLFYQDHIFLARILQWCTHLQSCQCRDGTLTW